MYLTKLPDGDRFVWSIYVNDHVPKVPDVPISGSAATLDKATAAMLKSYGKMLAKAGPPAAELTTLSACRPAALSWIPRPALACGHEYFKRAQCVSNEHTVCLKHHNHLRTDLENN